MSSSTHGDGAQDLELTPCIGMCALQPWGGLGVASGYLAVPCHVGQLRTLLHIH